MMRSIEPSLGTSHRFIFKILVVTILGAIPRPATILAENFAFQNVVNDENSSASAGESTAEVVRKSIDMHVSAMFESMSKEAKQGYRHLTERPYLPPDFNDKVVQQISETALKRPWPSSRTNQLHRVWEAFGISPRPETSDAPLQYVVTPGGDYVMNCFACHGGNTFGAIFPGAPNTTYALASLTESVRRIKLQEKMPLTHMDVGSIVVPLGANIGTTNAVNFGVALMSHRDKDLNVVSRIPPSMLHHDLDAPPWWHYSKKQHLYADGFAEKGHRGLMQFMLVRQNGPEKFWEWEEAFREVEQFISSIKPPQFPFSIDQAVAQRGKNLFDKHCASCHGTYGLKESYPEVNVPIDDIGTDRLRWEALTAKHREGYGNSWFAHYGSDDTISQPEGYTAPPLDGIWASAPYLHNGSVPTLKHLLKIDERPAVWRRTTLDLNLSDIGFMVEVLDQVPSGLTPVEERWYFNTRSRGKSAKGHDYPDVLSSQEKLEVLEYLKSL